MGYFVGSYKVFVDRLVERITAGGSSVRTGVRVDGLQVEDGHVAGLVAGGERIPLDAVVATTPLPVVRRLLPEPYRAAVDWPEDVTFLGVVCGLLLLDRSLSPYYTLNIAEESIPLTGVIETTNLIAPEHVGGHHLVYLPRYVLPQNPFARLPDEALRDVYLTSLKRLFPAFRESWIRHLFVFRERFVEPLHRIGQRRPVVPVAGALPGLLVVNNGQIYPELTNCQASVRHALRVLPEVLQQVGRRAPAAPLAGIAA
jgi:protoporphyrinogen oxidase